jgi:hypothetical protein
MIESLVFLALALGAVVLVPLVILGVLLKLLALLIFLPFKILGGILRLGFGVVGLALKVLFSGIGLAFGLVALVLFAVLIPLLPVLLIAGAVWLVVRSSRPRPLVRHHVR